MQARPGPAVEVSISLSKLESPPTMGSDDKVGEARVSTHTQYSKQLTCREWKKNDHSHPLVPEVS